MYGCFSPWYVKIVARENAECLVTLENHYSQWLVIKNTDAQTI